MDAPSQITSNSPQLAAAAVDMRVAPPWPSNVQRCRSQLRLSDRSGGKRLATAGRGEGPARELHCHRTIGRPLSWTATRELASSLAARCQQQHSSAFKWRGPFDNPELSPCHAACVYVLVARTEYSVGDGNWKKSTHTHTHHTFTHDYNTHSPSNCSSKPLLQLLGLGSPDGLAEHSLCLTNYLWGTVDHACCVASRRQPPPVCRPRAQNETAARPGAPSAVDTANQGRASAVTKAIHPSLP